MGNKDEEQKKDKIRLDETHIVEREKRIADAKEAHQKSRKTEEFGNEQMTVNNAATRLMDKHFNKFKWVIEWEDWLVWDGKRWSKVRGKSELGKKTRKFAAKEWDRLKNSSMSADEQKAYIRYAKQVNDGNCIEKLMKLAAYDERVAISQEELDADEFLLNCNNCTYDLKSGKFHDHQQEDLLTQLLPVDFDKSAKCDEWGKFINMIFDGDSDLIRYVKTIAGYALAGTIEETILPICIGNGRNGKSTFWNTIAAILGDYAGTVSQDLLLPAYNQHPTEIADLKGKRFVAVEEPSSGRGLDEQRVKAMTGDDVLKARRMRENFWSFKPTHTFWLSANYLPEISGDDEGIWRRVKTIPFNIDLADVVDEIRTDFRAELVEEYPGILQWLIQGWHDYQKTKLTPIEPEAVRQATAQYRKDENSFTQFIAEGLIEAPGRVIESGEAYRRYCEFERNMAKQLTRKKFGMEMAKKFKKEVWDRKPFRKKTVYSGVGDIIDDNGNIITG